jgi:hypothetical protein
MVILSLSRKRLARRSDQKMRWEEEWVETARNIVRDEFDQTYAFMDFDEEVISMKKVLV